MQGVFADTLAIAAPAIGSRTTPEPASRRRWSTEVKLVVAVLAVLAGLLIAAFVTFRSIRDYADSSTNVARQLDILASLHSLNADISNNQMDVVGYVMDEDPGRIGGIHHRKSASRATVVHLATLIVDPQQQAALAEVAAGVDEIGQLHARAIEARSAGGMAPALKLLNGPAMTGALASVGTVVSDMVGRERELFREHQQLAQGKRRHVVWNFGFVLLLFAGTTMLLFGQIRHDLRVRTRIGRDREEVRRFLEAIITAIPHPILIKDASTLNYVLVNPAMAALLGQPTQSVLEKNDFAFFEPGRAARARELDQQALEQGTLATDEVQVPTAQRGERTFRTIRLPFTVGADEVGYLLTIAEDITDILSSQNMVAAANRLLRQQAEELRAANNELSNFSYTVSHDLRTPLRAIDGFAEMLSDDYADTLDDRGKRYISVVRESSQRMGELIDALLYYTRIGREPLKSAPVSMNQLISGAREAVTAAFPGIDLAWDITPVPDAHGDRDLLRQAWTNLLMNAAKFSQKAHGPMITIRGSTDGNECTYSVSDNGVGFDMQFYSKLFGLFQRLHTEAPYAGAGVGLAIVHRVIAHHGGRVWATSAPGSGATFSFVVPASSRAGRTD